jgi:hypothetical protein
MLDEDLSQWGADLSVANGRIPSSCEERKKPIKKERETYGGKNYYQTAGT